MNIIDLYDKSYNLYLIGGIVRDELLQKHSTDIDITIEGNAIEFCKNLKIGEILQINPDFGTVKMNFDNEFIDFASTRAEIYEKKGHLPTITKIGCSLKEDILRRDFTVNSLAKNLQSGEIIDYVGGIEDLKNKKLRILHEKSFIDDPTRIIRGLKFAIRFDFELEENTKKLQDEYLENINYDMSYKRLKDELISAFNLNSQLLFEKFIKQNIYKLLTNKVISIPDKNIENIITKYKNEINNIWLIYAGLVDTDKLPLNKQEQKIITDYEKLLDLKIDTPFEIYKNLAGLNIESIILYGLKTDFKKVEEYLNKLRKIKIQINGNDLNNLGYTPSELYSKCFDEILKVKLNNPKLTKAEELQIAKEIL